MNNEEKAENIALDKCRYYGGEYDSYKECYQSALEMAQWKDENPTITAELFRQCIYMLNDICYEQGTGVDETDIEYVIKMKKLP